MKDYLTIAQIVKPQGIRGEVKVLAMTDAPEDLKSFTRVYVGGNAYKILKVRPQGGNCAYLTLSGVADRNAAELLRGKEVTVLRGDAPALPEDTYYIEDIIGCTLSDGEKEIGVVEEIMPARTDIYTVACNGGKKLTFPAVKGLIQTVDIAARQVVVDPVRLAEVALED